VSELEKCGAVYISTVTKIAEYIRIQYPGRYKLYIGIWRSNLMAYSKDVMVMVILVMVIFVKVVNMQEL